jgi:flagellar basal body-associated protein FliL
MSTNEQSDKKPKHEEKTSAQPVSPATPPAQTTSASSPQTNLLAILSLVFAFLFSLIGLIIGIIALKQIKQTGEAGKGLAIAGIVISAVKMVFGTIIIIVLIVTAIAGVSEYESCVESGRTDCGSDVTEQTEEQIDESDAVQIDTFTEAGELRVKVNSVSEFAGDEFNKPNQGNVYLNIELEVMNDGFDTRNISDYYVTLKDSENKKYNNSFRATPQGAPTIVGELPSKETVKGNIGFEVPEKATGLKLYFESGDFDGKVGIVELDR